MDGLSAAAGVISVVSLAIQLAESVHKIEEFWREVKDAPDEVRDFLDKLGMLGRILDQAEKLDLESKNTSIRAEALNKCREKIDLLATIVEDLKAGFVGTKTQRKWSSLKAVWRKDKITNSRKCLEEIMQVVSLAELTHQSETQERHNRLLTQSLDDFRAQQKISLDKLTLVASFVADLEAQRRSQPITVPIPPTNIDPPLDQAMRKAVMNPGIQDGLKPMLPSSEPLSCTRRSPQGELRTGSPSSGVDSVAIFEKKSEEICSINSMSHPYIKRTTVQPGELQHYTLALAKIYYQTRLNRIEFVDEADDQLVLPVDDRQEFEASVTVHLNRWVSSRGFSISYSRYGQGCFPTLRFRQFNVRSEESLIFEFCSSGNVDGVRSLLSRGEASPFDTDPEGWTPLHYAASAQHPGLCKFLIRLGASGETLTLSNTSPLYLAIQTGFTREPRALRNAGTAISSIYEDTVRALVGPGQSNPSIEDNDGLTCYDLIRTEYMGGSTALLTWLLRATAYDFDPDHRDNLGRTLLMRLAGSSVASSTVDALCSLGADVNARVTKTEQADPRTVGMTALHFAASRLTKHEETISTMKELLIRVAHPHTTSDAGETPTDIILRSGDNTRFSAWYTILSELGFDIKRFARAEIEAHADVHWFAANPCDEYLLAHFGFLLKFDDDSGLTSYQSPSDDEGDGLEYDTEVISYDDLVDELSLFSDSDDDVGESPASEYHSAEEDNLSSSQELTINRPIAPSCSPWQESFLRTTNPRNSRRGAAGWKAYRRLLKDPKTGGTEDGDMVHWDRYQMSCCAGPWRRWNEQYDGLQYILYCTGASL